MGDKVLVTGASGGVGSALVDLGKMFELEVFGIASLKKQESLKHFGATLIDYKSQDFVEAVRKIKPEGLDYAFDGVGGEYIKKSIKTLRRGGILIEYGYSLKSFSYFIKSVFDMFSGLGKGVKAKNYGISINYKINKKFVLEDMAELFSLLENVKLNR